MWGHNELISKDVWDLSLVCVFNQLIAGSIGTLDKHTL